MGRKKIKIQRIEDDRNRHVTFTKRKNGIFKKAMELSKLCDCEIALIVFDSNEKLYQYSSASVDQILLKYTEYRDPYEMKDNTDYEILFGEKKKRAKDGGSETPDKGQKSKGDADDHELLDHSTDDPKKRMQHGFQNMLKKDQLSYIPPSLPMYHQHGLGMLGGMPPHHMLAGLPSPPNLSGILPSPTTNMLFRQDFSPNAQAMFGSHHQPFWNASGSHEKNSVLGLNLVPSDFERDSMQHISKQSFHYPNSKHSTSPGKSNALYQDDSSFGDSSSVPGEYRELSMQPASYSGNECNTNVSLHSPKSSDPNSSSKMHSPTGDKSSELNQSKDTIKEKEVRSAESVDVYTEDALDRGTADQSRPDGDAENAKRNPSCDSCHTSDPLGDRGASCSPRKRHRVDL